MRQDYCNNEYIHYICDSQAKLQCHMPRTGVYSTIKKDVNNLKGQLFQVFVCFH